MAGDLVSALLGVHGRGGLRERRSRGVESRGAWLLEAMAHMRLKSTLGDCRDMESRFSKWRRQRSALRRQRQEPVDRDDEHRTTYLGVDVMVIILSSTQPDLRRRYQLTPFDQQARGRSKYVKNTTLDGHRG
jgi:hypothetical protein